MRPNVQTGVTQSIELARAEVKWERFPTFLCQRCKPKVSTRDPINATILDAILEIGRGTRLPYMRAFRTSGYEEFGFIACICTWEGDMPLDGMFMCELESGWHVPEGHPDRVLINRFSHLKAFASMAVTLEHESAHAAGVAHDEEMDEIERRARTRIARAIPKLPPANVMANQKDAYRPGCPRAGERRCVRRHMPRATKRKRE